MTLIILNWNGRPYLADCLTSLQAQTYARVNIVVVDNASDDDSVSFIQAHYPEVTVIARERNDGFAAGNNVALRRLESDIAVLINPDVIAPPDWLERLIAALGTDTAIGVAGCKLLYEDGETVQHAGGYIKRPQGMPGHYEWGQKDSGETDAGPVRDVEYVIGAAMAIRREVLERIGLLDDGFFLYFEDTDFCYRARQAGYRVVYTPVARLIHLESVFTRKGSAPYLRHMHTGRWRFLLKHETPAILVRETVPAELAWLAQRDLMQRRAAARAYATSLAHLPAILTRRRDDGGEPVGEADQAALSRALGELWRAAWRPVPLPVPPPPGIARLQAGSLVAERPFRSRLPLLGPLIAHFRALWNRVATRAYLRPILAQQNSFNELVAGQLAVYEALLEQQAAQLMAAEARLADRPPTVDAVSPLHHEAAALYARLQTVEKRLTRLTERQRSAVGDEPSARQGADDEVA